MNIRGASIVENDTSCYFKVDVPNDTFMNKCFQSEQPYDYKNTRANYLT